MTENRVSPPRRRRTRRGWLLPVCCLVLGFLLGRFTMGNAHEAQELGEESAAQETPDVSAEQTEAQHITDGDIHTGALILVSNEVPYIFPEDQDLARVLDEKNPYYLVRDGSVYLERTTMNALNAMMEDFAAQGGEKTVNVVAGHRTKEFQQHLFDQSAAANGLEHARRYVAQPGYSEHHTGYALDFSLYYPDGTSDVFDGTGDYAWLASHAAEYGFVLRYPADKESVTGIAPESWHYRYVGIPHAALMAEQGMCLEEYLEYLRQFSYAGEHLFAEYGGVEYEIYTCGEDALYVPSEEAYTLSGNNMDGFIVTVG